MSGSRCLADPGTAGSHSGIRSGRTIFRSPRVTAGSSRASIFAAAATASRAAASTTRKCSAVSVATRSSRAECRWCRNAFIIAPVSIPTGQASLQAESPAQVSTAS